MGIWEGYSQSIAVVYFSVSLRYGPQTQLHQHHLLSFLKIFNIRNLAPDLVGLSWALASDFLITSWSMSQACQVRTTDLEMASPLGLATSGGRGNLNIKFHKVSISIPQFLLSNFFNLIFIGIQLIYNVVLVSGVQQSESIIHIPISTHFQILFPYRALQSTEQSSLCYTVGSYYLSILHTVVCICQSQSPNLSLLPPPPFPLGNHKCVFYICDSISVL